MTILQKDDVDYLANLAKLIIPKENYPAVLEKLNNILKIVEKMNSVDTTGIEPLAHPYDETQPLRADEVTEPNQRSLFQNIAPQTESGLYIVPAVIDNE